MTQEREFAGAEKEEDSSDDIAEERDLKGCGGGLRKRSCSAADADSICKRAAVGLQPNKMGQFCLQTVPEDQST